MPHPRHMSCTQPTLRHKVAVNLISPSPPHAAPSPAPSPPLPRPFPAPHPPVWTKLFNFLKASFVRYFFSLQNMYDASIVQILHKKAFLKVSLTTEKERVNRIWNGVVLSNWVAVKYFVGSPETNTYNRAYIVPPPPRNTLKTKVLWKDWVDRKDRFP
jgi:hypothetical protein